MYINRTAKRYGEHLESLSGLSVSLVSPTDIKSYSGTVQAEVYRDNEEKDECRDVGTFVTMYCMS